MISPLTILVGDVREQLKTLPDESVNCVVTSPPYWGLRDYGVAGQLGLEKTMDCGLQGKVRLRCDLTPNQKERVARWLLGETGFDALKGDNGDKA